MNEKNLTKEQLEHFYNQVLGPLNVTRTEWQAILESGIIPDLVESKRKIGTLSRRNHRLAGSLDEWPEPKVFDVVVTINRNLRLHQMIWRSAALDVVNPDLLPDRMYLGKKMEEVTVSIFHFGKGRSMEQSEVLEELRAYGYRPVLAEELLALSATRRDLQLKFPIAGVGCLEPNGWFWMIDSVPGKPNWQRRTDIYPTDNTIYDFYRVAAVRDESIIPTKTLYSRYETTEDKIVAFVDSEHAAMKSVYRQEEPAAVA